MVEVVLAKVKVLSGRVERFGRLVQTKDVQEHRKLFRAGMDELQDAIREARDLGVEAGDIDRAVAMGGHFKEAAVVK